MADTIEDFFVSLGYHVDEESQTKLERAVEETTRRLTLFAIAIKLAAESWNDHLTHLGDEIEKLHYTARLTTSTIEDIQAMSYAASQLGISGETMGSSIKRFAEMLELPNTKQYLDSWIGKNEGLSAEEKFLRFFEATVKDPFYVQAQRFERFGTPREVLWRMRQVGVEAIRKEFEEGQKKIDAAGTRGKSDPLIEFMHTWHRINFSLHLLQLRFAQLLGPTFTHQLDEFSQWLDANSDKIARGLGAIAEALLGFAHGLAVLVMTAPQWLPVLEQMARNVDEWGASLGKAVENTIGWKSALVLLVALLLGSRFRMATAAISALAGAFLAMLAIFGVRSAAAQTGGGGGATPGTTPGAATGGSATGGSTGPGYGGTSPTGRAEEPRGIRGRIGGVYSRVRRAVGLDRPAGAGAVASSGEFYDAIIAAEGTAKRGDPYNEVLGYGQYGRPAKNLTEMTFREWIEEGNKIRARHGSSSAMGAFQIVGSHFTPAELARAGLTLEDKGTPENQRKLAWLIYTREGLGAWEGFKFHAEQRARAAAAARFGPRLPGLTAPPAPVAGAPATPATSAAPEVPAYRTPGGDLSKSVGDKTSSVQPAFRTIGYVSPLGESTWRRSIDISSEKRLTIDAYGVSDPAATASLIDHHVRASHKEMVDAAATEGKVGPDIVREGRDRYGDN